MGHRVAPIHHSLRSLTSLRSRERIGRLGGQKIEVRGKEEREYGRIDVKVIGRHVPSTHIYNRTAMVVFIVEAEYTSSWLCRFL